MDHFLQPNHQVKHYKRSYQYNQLYQRLLLGSRPRPRVQLHLLLRSYQKASFVQYFPTRGILMKQLHGAYLSFQQTQDSTSRPQLRDLTPHHQQLLAYPN